MISDSYDSIIMINARNYAVPFEWIKAIIGAESDFDPRAYRAEPQIHDASYGLMQILGRTAAGLGFTGPIEELYDPATNISLGTMLLSQLRDRWGDDFASVYSAYNSGSGTSYLSNSSVAAHVERAERYLADVIARTGQVISDYPAETGAGALILGLAALYFILRRRKGKKS